MRQRLLYGFLLLFVCLTSSIRSWALEQDGNGVYQIGTPQDLIDFATLVNTGGNNMSVNAVLTDDIDMTGQPWDNPIGNWLNSNGYKGHFDGQGHKITNLVYTTAMNYHGFFGVLVDGAVVENFSIYGTITNENYDAISVIAYSKNDAISNNIRNIHSYLTLISSGGDKKVGGILANGNNGTTYVDRCIFSGSISSTGKTNCGGIVAYIQNNASANVHITNCIFDGNLESTVASTYCGGIVGYIGDKSSKYTIKSCLSVGTITSSVAGAIFGYVRNGGGGSSYNYYLGGKTSGLTEGTGADYNATLATAKQMKSGEVCFNLNIENGENIAFYQNLGEDDLPTLDSTHKCVYAIGERLCDGSFSGDVVYSNEDNGGGGIPAHQYDEGYCSVCGAMDLDYMTPVDGWFEIGTGRQLRWFADYVNLGNYNANAKLTDDLVLYTEEQMAIIGTSSSTAYKGIFDGQGHEITGFHLTVNEFVGGCGYGMFGNTNGATIKNFSINGEMTFENGGAAPDSNLGCALVGFPDGKTLIQNIRSEMEIYGNINSHVGGIAGSLRTATVDRCEFAGQINGLSTTNCCAGIAGYTSAGTITNCIFSGSVEGDGTGYFAGILGYVNNTSAVVKNCLSVGTVENEESQWTAAIVGRLRSINTYSNNFYKGEINGVGGGEIALREDVLENTTQVTEPQLTSGEITWALNGSTYVIPAFYQTLSVDDVPVFDPTHDVVYQTVDGFGSMPIDGSMDEFQYAFSELQDAMAEEIIACKQVVDNYIEASAPLADIDTYEAFVAAFAELKPLLDAIDASVKCYEAYMGACTAAAEYMEKNDVGGKEFEQLNTYLTTDAEPSEEFPNGTYLYIIRTHVLTDEQIVAEKAEVEARLQTAIANNYVENTDITNMLVNATFVDGTTGWETSATPTFATVNGTTAAEVKDTFSMTQTLTGLKNGIYLLGANAAQSSGSDLLSQYYSAQLIANGNMNFVQVLSENAVEEKAAADDKEINGLEVYVPASAQGFTYAMTAGRYENYTAVRVTDGKLTVSIANLGTGFGIDQVLMGGLRLVYLGKGDTTCEGLNAVLESYRNRAQTIINFEYKAEEYEKYPNISVELKNALQTCCDAIAEAQTGDEKMALVDRFSALMKDVYDCRKAYIELIKVSDEMIALSEELTMSGALSGEDDDAIYKMYMDAQQAFVDGSYTLAQALEAIKNLREYGNIIPPTDEDGTYLLSTPRHLAAFAAKITYGDVKINGKLVADINLEELEWLSAGTHGTHNKIDTATPYEGTFDGQGHKITNLSITVSSESYYGLFACASGTIKNFSISGNITMNAGDFVGAAVGQMTGGKLENVHSSVNIEAGNGSKHTGGVAGAITNSVEVIGCSYSGTLNVGSNSDSFGGIGGYAGAMTMSGCLFDGVIEGDEGNEAVYVGGLIGYANSTAAGLANNLSVGKITLVNAGAISGTFRSSVPIVYANNFWQTGYATRGFNTDKEMPKVIDNTFEVSAEQMASGEVAYKLNTEENNYFYQTLGQDAYPVLDNTHSIVYPVGEFTCDGRAKGDVSYSNDKSGYKRDSHDYVDGACTVCHITPDGCFGIRNGEELRLFASKVNQGEVALNAKLVADIDLSEVITDENPWVPAGDWGQKSGISSLAYKGHFDGQGHTITGFNAIPSMNYFGIFGVVSTGVLIENFTIYGTITHNNSLSGSTKTSGVVGYARDTETTIRNIHSYLNINNTVGSARPGGILGSAVNGTTNIERCTYSGTLQAGNLAGNYGGIVGYVNNNALAIVNITDCLFDGAVVNEGANGETGGIVGYSNGGIVTIKNSLSVGTVNAGQKGGQFFGAVKSTKSTLPNSYYMGDNINGEGSVDIQANATTAEELASGKICYLLNEENKDDKWTWYQTLSGDDKDAYPVLDNTHKVVLYNALDGYYNMTKDDEDGIGNVNDNDNLNKVGIYNLAGQRMSKLQKGINIVRGKKILY
ncbi:MAG: hypothetical protein K5672_08870 [Bacteroidaceae bacterium]|nr:hypothetical protein [Bacteroidaceae bacterium]